jgi:hypothetical protein
MTDYVVTVIQPSEARRQLGALAGKGGGWCRIEGGPVPVSLRLGKADDGRLACTAVAFDGGDVEITARMLRSMPLGELVAIAAGERSDGASGEIHRWLIGETAEGGVTRVRPGPGGYPHEHYEQVAAAYRQALTEAPRSPVKWLTEQLHASEPTVRRWVQRARDLGLLGASTPGRAGETPTKSTTKGSKR